jgi:hypothetical protein
MADLFFPGSTSSGDVGRYLIFAFSDGRERLCLGSTLHLGAVTGRDGALFDDDIPPPFSFLDDTFILDFFFFSFLDFRTEESSSEEQAHVEAVPLLCILLRISILDSPSSIKTSDLLPFRSSGLEEVAEPNKAEARGGDGAFDDDLSTSFSFLDDDFFSFDSFLLVALFFFSFLDSRAKESSSGEQAHEEEKVALLCMLEERPIETSDFLPFRLSGLEEAAEPNKAEGRFEVGLGLGLGLGLGDSVIDERFAS